MNGPEMPRAILSALLLCLAAVQLAPAALAEDKAAPCQLVKVADLPVTVTPGNQILVAGKIKDQDVQFQVDTGSYRTIFDHTVISRFGALNAGKHYQSIGVGGETDNIRMTIPGLAIGSYPASDMSLLVSSKHFLGDGIYALLGEDFLEMFDLDIDLAKNTIGLFQHNSCAAEPVYWANTFSEADLHVREDKIYIAVELDGKPFEAVLDTGADRSVISTTFTKRLGLDENAPGMTKAGFSHGIDQHKVDVYRYRFSELRIGDEVVKNPTLNVANLAPVKFDHSSMYRIQDGNADTQALLGADFVKTHHIYVATRSMKMYFTYNGGGIFSPPKTDSPTAATK
jgi:predicted aspartyl protease